MFPLGVVVAFCANAAGVTAMADANIAKPITNRERVSAVVLLLPVRLDIITVVQLCF